MEGGCNRGAGVVDEPDGGRDEGGGLDVLEQRSRGSMYRRQSAYKGSSSMDELGSGVKEDRSAGDAVFCVQRDGGY